MNVVNHPGNKLYKTGHMDFQFLLAIVSFRMRCDTVVNTDTKCRCPDLFKILLFILSCY